MSEPFDIETRWPELFEQLDPVNRRAVVQSFASSWHEGWIPNREDVEDLTDLVRGAIDVAEYERRSAAAAERYRGKPPVVDPRGEPYTER